MINLDKQWEELTVEEKLDELSHAMSAVVSMALELDQLIRDTAGAGKNVVKAVQIALDIASHADERAKSVERRVDAMTSKDGMATIWSKN
jgi:hypothetical protein